MYLVLGPGGRHKTSRNEFYQKDWLPYDTNLNLEGKGQL